MNTIEKPLISIIVPVYNVELYINDCLNSIRKQTYKNIEIIVVEDLSTDGSKKALQPHFKDKRVKLIQHEKNSGLSSARNTGIEEAKGEYMIFVDSDDIIDSRLIESCLTCAFETGADVVTYDFTPFQDGISYEELTYPVIFQDIEPALQGTTYFNLPHFAWLKFIRSSVIRDSSLQFPKDLYYEDWPFHWHLGLSTKKIYHLPVGFYFYRQRSTSITGSTGKKLLDLFIIHSQVMMLVDRYNALEIKDILASKIRQSHWIILTRIDAELLEEALKASKKAERRMRENGYKTIFDFKDRITVPLLYIPSNISLPALKAIRLALNKSTKIRSKRY